MFCKNQIVHSDRWTKAVWEIFFCEESKNQIAAGKPTRMIKAIAVYIIYTAMALSIPSYHSCIAAYSFHSTFIFLPMLSFLFYCPTVITSITIRLSRQPLQILQIVDLATKYSSASFEYETPEECFFMMSCFCSGVSLGFRPTLPEAVPLMMYSKAVIRFSRLSIRFSNFSVIHP